MKFPQIFLEYSDNFSEDIPFSVEDLSPYYDGIKNVKMTGQKFNDTIYCPINRSWFICTISEAGKDRYAISCTDITQLKRIQMELSEKERDLQKQIAEKDLALQTQSRFLAIMSHGETS